MVKSALSQHFPPIAAQPQQNIAGHDLVVARIEYRNSVPAPSPRDGAGWERVLNWRGFESLETERQTRGWAGRLHYPAPAASPR